MKQAVALSLSLVAAACVAIPAARAADEATHPPPAVQAAQVCGVDGWCWYNPLPQGAQLSALWGAAWNDVWAGGRDGLLHYDGAGWRAVTLPAEIGAVRSLWGSGPRDVWAAGDGIARWDGKTWRVVAGLPDKEDTSYVLTGSGPHDVWALADSGDGPEEEQTILHWDGARWRTDYVPFKVATAQRALNALWTSGPGEVWAVGVDLASRASLVLRRTSQGWSPSPTAGGDPLLSIWGAASDDVWAAGGETILHWDGARWAATKAPAEAALRRLWGISSTDAWASGNGIVLHWDGRAWLRQWTQREGVTLLRAGWSSGPQDAWAAGDDGALLHFDGTAWAPMPRLDVQYLDDVSADAPSDAWAVGGFGAALRYDGAAWTAVATPTREPLYGVWAGSPQEAFAVGASADCLDFVLRWDGKGWSYAHGPVHGSCLAAVWGVDARHAWAIGLPGLLAWDGEHWSSTGPRDAARSVWASSASDVWVLQDSTPGGPNPPGNVYHWNGVAWTLLATHASAQLRRLWGSGPRDVWAVGDAPGSIAHWNGASWSLLPTGLASDGGLFLSAIWGTGPADAWAAGPGLPILHWDGHRWSAAAGAEKRSVSALGGSGDGVWAVGASGAIWGRSGRAPGPRRRAAPRVAPQHDGLR
jgi:hypothetical protein